MPTYEDAVLKQAWAKFAREALPFFGIHKKAKADAPTELVSLEVKYQFMDYTFLMEDDTYSHWEFHSKPSVTKKNLRKFRSYEAVLSDQTGKEVITYLLYTGRQKSPNSVLKTGVNTYRVVPINAMSIDGDSLMASIQKKIKVRQPLSKEDATFAAFNAVTGGTSTIQEKIEQTLEVARHFDPATEYELQAMAYAFALKFLAGDQLQLIKERVKMTILGQMLRDDAIKEAIEKAAEMLAELGIPKSDAAKKLEQKYTLSPEEAKGYIDRYYLSEEAK